MHIILATGDNAIHTQMITFLSTSLIRIRHIGLVRQLFAIALWRLVGISRRATVLVVLRLRGLVAVVHDEFRVVEATERCWRPMAGHVETLLRPTTGSTRVRSSYWRNFLVCLFSVETMRWPSGIDINQSINQFIYFQTINHEILNLYDT